MSKAKLTPKQQRFVQEYLIDLNATQAAIRAGYSPRTANEQGSQNLAKVNVSQAIRKAMEERAKRTEVTQDEVIRELKRIAFLDPREVMSWGPDGVVLKDSKELSEDAARCVSEASQTVSKGGGSIHVKLCSKLDALEKLARHLGMFKNKVEHSGNISTTHIYLPQKGDGSIPVTCLTPPAQRGM